MRNIYIAAILLLIATLILNACASNRAQSGATRLAEPVKSVDALKLAVNTGAAFEDKKKITIAGFKVAFITQMKGINRPAGGLLSGSSVAKAKATVVLEGIPRKVMQQITDEAYKDFKTKLTANGYTIIPYSELAQKHEKLADLEHDPVPYETSTPIPGINGESVVFSPTSMSMRLMNGQAGATKVFNSPGYVYSVVAEDNDVAFVDVYYAVNFSRFGGHVSIDTSSISVDQGISVLENSGLNFIGGLGGTFSSDIGSMNMEQPLGNDIEFAVIKEKEKSTAEKTDQALANTFAILFGGGTQVRSTYIYKADAEKYKKAVLDVLGKSNTALSNKMLTLRNK